MKELQYQDVRQMLLRCAQRIFRCEPYLTKADSAIGDGDHGNGMVNGMLAARKVLEKDRPDNDIYALYAEMAEAMQRRMGGASGMIFSTLFSGDAKNRAPAEVFTPAMLADQMKAGLQAIQELGHAQPGDKTMVDALWPAVQVMQEKKEKSFEEMLCTAADAAYAGMESTKAMTAKYGRAKNLGERAIGFADAGAVTTWLILREMADFVSGETTPDPDPSEIMTGSDEKPASVSFAKKLINDPLDAVREEGEGFLAAFGRDILAVPGVNGFVRREIPQGKTSLLIGGGSGHEPMFGFFLGDHLADAAANGNVFTSPDPVTIAAVAEAADRGAGVLFVYGNYAGDNLNFDKAADLLREKGIETRTVRVKDDVASAPKERMDDRRGIAGDVFMVKIAGAACAHLSLDEAYRVTEKANRNLFTIGVGLSGATLPGKTEPIFTLPGDEIEYGLGIHGEPGVKRVKMQKADQIVEEMVSVLLNESGIRKGDTVCTYINGLGSTTLMELMIMNRKLAMILSEKGIRVHDMDVNSYVTTMEMAGASISILKLDDELQKYFDMPCSSPYYTKK